MQAPDGLILLYILQYIVPYYNKPSCHVSFCQNTDFQILCVRVGYMICKFHFRRANAAL